MRVRVREIDKPPKTDVIQSQWIVRSRVTQHDRGGDVVERYHVRLNGRLIHFSMDLTSSEAAFDQAVADELGKDYA